MTNDNNRRANSDRRTDCNRKIDRDRRVDSDRRIDNIKKTRLATIRSGLDHGLFWRPFKKTGPYGPTPPDCSSVSKILDQTVRSGLFMAWK